LVYKVFLKDKHQLQKLHKNGKDAGDINIQFCFNKVRKHDHLNIYHRMCEK